MINRKCKPASRTSKSSRSIKTNKSMENKLNLKNLRHMVKISRASEMISIMPTLGLVEVLTNIEEAGEAGEDIEGVHTEVGVTGGVDIGVEDIVVEEGAITEVVVHMYGYLMMKVLKKKLLKVIKARKKRTEKIPISLNLVMDTVMNRVTISTILKVATCQQYM